MAFIQFNLSFCSADAFSLMKMIVWWDMTLSITVSEFDSHSIYRRRMMAKSVLMWPSWDFLASIRVSKFGWSRIRLTPILWSVGHLMEKIEAENLLHRAFSVFLFNSKYELLLQVFSYDHLDCEDDSRFRNPVSE